MGGAALTLPDAPEAGDFPFDHVLRRTVVLPEHRVLFLPVPKAGCTTILHILADLAGLSADAFDSYVRDGDLVLVKGSRGIRTDLVVDRLKAEFA